MRKTINLIARAGLVLCGVFSLVNIAFVLLGIDRVMPAALSMTGFLAKSGATAVSGKSFYLIYSAVLACIVCVAFILCVLLGSRRGWLTAALILLLIDCVGVAVLVYVNGFRSSYWFEIAGHALMLVLLVAAMLSKPKKAAGAQ